MPSQNRCDAQVMLNMMTNIVRRCLGTYRYLGTYTVVLDDSISLQYFLCIYRFCRYKFSQLAKCFDIYLQFPFWKIVFHLKAVASIRGSFSVVLSRSLALTHGSVQELGWGIDQGPQL